MGKCKNMFSEALGARIKACEFERSAIVAVIKQAKKMKCSPETLSPGILNRRCTLKDELIGLYTVMVKLKFIE